MKRAIITILALIVLGIGSWYAFSLADSKTESSTNNSNAVVVVNGEEISQSNYNNLQAQIVADQQLEVDSLNAEEKEQLKNQVIDNLISQALLRQAVAGSSVMSLSPNTEIDGQIQAIKGQFEDEAAYKAALETEGITEEGLRSQIKSDLATQGFLEQELKLSTVTATNEEVVSIYEQIAANQEVPPLDQIYDQVEQTTIQQKQQQIIGAYIQQLRSEAEIKILI